MFNRWNAVNFASYALPAALLLGSASSLLTADAAAQGADSPAVTSAQSDVARACAPGATTVDRATCLKEAAAAKGEAKRGQLTSPDAAYDANALRRCEVLPEPDKQQCQLRVRGAGSTDGSVGGGGLIREIRTRVPDTTSPASPSSDGTAK
ncbi:MAG: hypothetical protein V4695_07065 [Pseudomonadota bacterium]